MSILTDLTKQFATKLKETDKQQHLVVSLVIASVFIAITDSIFFGLLTAIYIGTLKELWDHYAGTGFCWWDMTFNFIGIFFAVGFYVTGTTLHAT